jgi:hypothetical protein
MHRGLRKPHPPVCLFGGHGDHLPNVLLSLPHARHGAEAILMEMPGVEETLFLQL